MSTIYAQRENYTPLIAEQVTGGTRDVYIKCSLGVQNKKGYRTFQDFLLGRLRGVFLERPRNFVACFCPFSNSLPVRFSTIY